MAQEVKIVARTFEVDNVAEISGYDTEQLEQATNEDLTILAGKAAGVCYMPDDYFENGVQNVEKAFKRAEQTAKSGHHSVYDHGHITMVIKTNKMMAMILNSLGVYATSEKSARYTKMQPETELEMQMYEKWKAKIRELIIAKYPDTDDVLLNTRLCKKLSIEKCTIVHNNVIEVSEDNFEYLKGSNKLVEVDNILQELKKDDTLPSAKLAQENARYMISVFTPTTLMYTISFRQMFLTMDYLADLINQCGHAHDSFSKKVGKSAVELLKAFSDVAGECRLHDNKNQYVRFLEAQHIGEIVNNDFQVYNDLKERFEAKKEVIGDSYTLVYFGSLAMLAQAQRHRTLRYTMFLQEAGKNGFYTPEIVKDAGLEDEWQADIKSVAYCIPQGTMVRITEQGLFEDFVLKCKERMCGRAQLEIMKSTVESIKEFNYYYQNLSYSNVKLLESITEPFEDGRGFKACARCNFKDFKCTEGCQWGPNKALSRLI